MDETYILLLLSDSNLPTGSFVASSALESYVKHGFFSPPDSNPNNTINFIQDSLNTYTHTALPFVSDAHQILTQFCDDFDFDKTLRDLKELDDLYDSMTLNHVAKRASKSQGVALLTLFSKGFSRPSVMSPSSDARQDNLHILLDRLKSNIRKEEVHGHLPICWGVLTGALGLTLERSQYLHIFLHARSLLSASVRLNLVGPYSAQQLLLHAVRPLVDREIERCKDLRTGITLSSLKAGFDEVVDGPANTWPLGEILGARHDLQHSRIFNS